MTPDFIISDKTSPQELLAASFNSNFSLKEIYKAKKVELGLSDRQVLDFLSMEAKTLNAILDGKSKRVNFLSIIKLANFLNISLSDIAISYINNLDKGDIREIQDSKDAAYIQEHFDVKSLEECFFFSKKNSVSRMAERIKTFFGFQSLYEYSNRIITAAFSRSKKQTKSDLMRHFWVVSAYERFKLLGNPNPYDREALKRLMPKIRPYTMDIDNGFKVVMKALFEVGVTIIYQPSLKNVQVRGATMVVNGKPCIVVCDYMKNYPTLWFTLLHELYHVLFDIKDIEKEVYHISDGIGDVFLTNEQEADKFAADYLLNNSRLNFVQTYIHSDVMIKRYASQCNIHPSIIYARYCYQTNEWKKYQKNIDRANKALEGINSNPFGKETIKETIEDVKVFYNI